MHERLECEVLPKALYKYIYLLPLRYMLYKSNVCLRIESNAGLNTFAEEWNEYNTFV